MALELSKGLATMHGHAGGVIANVDVQLAQFGRGEDGLIKILDFNRAEVPLYDEKQERYCTFSNGVPLDGSVSIYIDIDMGAILFKPLICRVSNYVSFVVSTVLPKK